MSPNYLLPGNSILIRGDEAARAQRIDLVQPQATSAVEAVGPWADELEKTREQARESGFAQGHREGHAAGMQAGSEQVAAEVANFAALIAEIDRRTDEMARQTAADVAELALEIAEAVLGHEVAASADPGADAIARCLELAPATGDIVACLNPQDLAQLSDVPGIEGRKLSLKADQTLERGDAIVTVGEATIDARLSESLRRVAEALR